MTATAGLILASTSPYRRSLLERLGLAFDTISPRVDEAPIAGESPAAMSARLALAKAEAVAVAHPQARVIGSDQVATIDGVMPIGKPGNHAAASAQLRQASGRELIFHTAVALVHRAGGFAQCLRVDTRVRFRTLDTATIERYLRAEPAYDCAGAAKSEGLGIALISRVDSEDPSALVGLPLIALCTLLESAGMPVLGPRPSM